MCVSSRSHGAPIIRRRGCQLWARCDITFTPGRISDLAPLTFGGHHPCHRGKRNSTPSRRFIYALFLMEQTLVSVILLNLVSPILRKIRCALASVVCIILNRSNSYLCFDAHSLTDESSRWCGRPRQPKSLSTIEGIWLAKRWVNGGRRVGLQEPAPSFIITFFATSIAPGLGHAAYVLLIIGSKTGMMI